MQIFVTGQSIWTMLSAPDHGGSNLQKVTECKKRLPQVCRVRVKVVTRHGADGILKEFMKKFSEDNLVVGNFICVGFKLNLV